MGWVIVILGTGSGIAFFMLMAHQSRKAAFIARTASVAVLADMLFTLSAAIAQPITGGVLMALSSTGFAEGWLANSLALSAIAGLFRVPAIFMQIEMRNLARIAATAISATKREAERSIAASGVAYVILCGRALLSRRRPMAAAPWCGHSRPCRFNCRPRKRRRRSSRSRSRILPRPLRGWRRARRTIPFPAR